MYLFIQYNFMHVKINPGMLLWINLIIFVIKILIAHKMFDKFFYMKKMLVTMLVELF